MVRSSKEVKTGGVPGSTHNWLPYGGGYPGPPPTDRPQDRFLGRGGKEIGHFLALIGGVPRRHGFWRGRGGGARIASFGPYKCQNRAILGPISAKTSDFGRGARGVPESLGLGP